MHVWPQRKTFFRGEVSLEDFIPETTLILTGVYYYEPRRVHIIEIEKMKFNKLRETME